MWDDYEILSELGTGNQGTVFHVRHKRTRDEFALKLVRYHNVDQANSAIREVKTLMNLKHPNIVAYADFFLHAAHGGKHYICLVIEFCASGTIEHVITKARNAFMVDCRNPLTEVTIRSWLLQASSALAHIHKTEHIHRDMKPSNLFVTAENTIRVGDFGVSAVGNTELERSLVGTPFYLAPEILRGQPYGPMVDIWGLGAIMVELMTLTDRAFNQAIARGDAEIIPELQADMERKGFSPELAALVASMIRCQPNGRPTAAAIVARLTAGRIAAQPLDSSRSYGVGATRVGGGGLIPQSIGASTLSMRPLTAPTTTASVFQLSSKKDMDGPPMLESTDLDHHTLLLSPGRQCEMCFQAPSTVECRHCEEVFCGSCDERHHRVGSRSQHTRLPILLPDPILVIDRADGGGVEAAIAAAAPCQMCERALATVLCPLCDSEVYCDACDRVKHLNTKRRLHERILLSVVSSPTGPVHSSTSASADVSAVATRRPQTGRRDELLRRPGSAAPLHPSLLDKYPRKGPRWLSLRIPEDVATLDEAIEMIRTVEAESKEGDDQTPVAAVGGGYGGKTLVPSERTEKRHRVAISAPLTLYSTIVIDVPVDIVAVGGASPIEIVLVDGAVFALGGQHQHPPQPLNTSNGPVPKVSGSVSGFSFSQMSQRPSTPDPEAADRLAALCVFSGKWDIENCKIVKSTGHGILADGPLVEIRVAFCAILEPQRCGIFIAGGASGEVCNNAIAHSQASGIIVKRSHLRLANNHITHAKEIGICVYYGSPSVYKCTVTASTGCGIVVRGVDSRGTIRACAVSQCLQAGAFFYDEASPTVEDCQFIGNRKSGILVKTAAEPLFRRNVIERSKEAGVYIHEGGKGKFLQNVVSKNGNAGVIITSGGNPTFSDNTICDNVAEAIWVCNNGGGSFTNNDLRSNKRGPKLVDPGCPAAFCGNIEK